MKMTYIMMILLGMFLEISSIKAELIPYNKDNVVCTLEDGETLTIGQIEDLAQEYIDENNVKDTDLSTEIDHFMTELCID